ETVFGQDGNFSREALFTRYEADLVSGLGNLASRVLALIESHFGGALPNRPTDKSVLSRNWVAVKTGTTENYEAFRFSLALNEIWTFITMVDNFLTQEQPWKKIKLPEQRDHAGGVLYEAAEAIRFVSILAHPVIPDGTQAIWRNLGQSGQISEQDLRAFEWGGLKPGTRVSKPAGTCPRVDYKEALERIEVMENEIRNPGAAQPAAATSSVGAAPATAPATVTTSTPATAPGGTPGGAPTAGIAPAAAPASTTITIDDFAKIDLRVGIVKTAERIPGADKLLKLQVDLGSETRQILSGIAPAYTPEELVGRKVVVVANLAPRKMRGLESAGMILAASDGADGKPILCTFADEIAAGAKVK
ncbi:MAG: methionine--tRNA ligase subunit beta, partial [Candidatus Acidiferrales bacterium]